MELCNYPKKEQIRYYEIEAIEIPIVYNKYGDHDPNGLLYVLKQDAKMIKEEAIKRWKQTIPQPYATGTRFPLSSVKTCTVLPFLLQMRNCVLLQVQLVMP